MSVASLTTTVAYHAHMGLPPTLIQAPGLGLVGQRTTYPKASTTLATEDHSSGSDEEFDVSYARAVAPAVLQWILDEYERAEDISEVENNSHYGQHLPHLRRSEVYTDYRTHCERMGMKPVAQSILGKLLRQAFTGLKVRRLGPRHDSHYCYIGLRRRAAQATTKRSIRAMDTTEVSPPSPSWGVPLSGHVGSLKRHMEDQQTQGEPARKRARLMPTASLFRLPRVEVPPIRFQNPANSELPRVQEFLGLLYAHQNKIMEHLSECHFDRMRDQTETFWKTLPSHFIPLLTRQEFVAEIDEYTRAVVPRIAERVFPDPLDEYPMEVLKSLRDYILDFEPTLHKWSQTIPLLASVVNIRSCHDSFQGSVLPRISLSMLAQQLRQLLSEPATIDAMRLAWQKVSTAGLYTAALVATGNAPLADPVTSVIIKQTLARLSEEFREYLEAEIVSPKDWAKWIDRLITSESTATNWLPWQQILCSVVLQELSVLNAVGTASPGLSALITLWQFLSVYITHTASARRAATIGQPAASIQNTSSSRLSFSGAFNAFLAAYDEMGSPGSTDSSPTSSAPESPLAGVAVQPTPTEPYEDLPMYFSLNDDEKQLFGL